jgi:hypothetical protein
VARPAPKKINNRAWEYLHKAREAYGRVIASPSVELAPEGKRKLAYEELLIAEGSDRCWWYSPEHDAANRGDFDQLFRGHLANVYMLLGIAPPEELSRPTLRVSVREFHQAPTGPVQPTIGGKVTSYFEWLGAGVCRVDQRTGAMHGSASSWMSCDTAATDITCICGPVSWRRRTSAPRVPNSSSAFSRTTRRIPA